MSPTQQLEVPSLRSDDPSRCDSTLSTDGYGAQVTVLDGTPSFTLVGRTHGEQGMIGEMLRRNLAGLWPRRQITVVVPPNWRPDHETIMSLAQAIHSGDICGAACPRDRQRDIRPKWSRSDPALDAIDVGIIAERMDAIDEHDGPLVGDYVLFADGVARRISYHWTDGAGWDGGCQTSDGGRFHLVSCGCSFSGSLYPPVPTASLSLTDEYRDGEAWIFHHGRQAGGNGVEFITTFRVYRSSENAPR